MLLGSFFLCKETENLIPIFKNWKCYPEIVKAEIESLDLHHAECSGDRSGYLIYKSNKGKFNI